jgi:hypothetical protein
MNYMSKRWAMNDKQLLIHRVLTILSNLIKRKKELEWDYKIRAQHT